MFNEKWRDEQDQLEEGGGAKIWIFKVEQPVYTERTSLKPAPLLPLSSFPGGTPGVAAAGEGSDCFPVFS